MATALSYPRIYVLNFIETDPQDIDLSGKTEGTDYFEIKIPQGCNYKPVPDIQITQYATGKGQIFRKNKWKGRTYNITGIVNYGTWATTLTQLKYMYSYLEGRQSSVANPDYLVIKYADDQYRIFQDEDNNDIEYARGCLLTISDTWDESDNFQFNINGKFEIVWS